MLPGNRILFFLCVSKEVIPCLPEKWGAKKAVNLFRNKGSKKAESPCRKWGAKNAGCRCYPAFLKVREKNYDETKVVSYQ